RAGSITYYLRTPCQPNEEVQVKPWWDLKKTVSVCSNSYRPAVFVDALGIGCSGQSGIQPNVESACGCGPNLIRCAPDGKTLADVRHAVQSEHKDTISYIVKNDLPIETFFTSVESFRSGLAEFMYQRWRIEAEEFDSLEKLPAWTSWPAEGKWAPRYE